MVTQLSKFISENLGLHFSEKHRNELCEKFYPAALKFGFSDPEDCIRWLLTVSLTQEQIEILSSYLTIGETHFYRDKAIYDSLEKYVLPEFINARRKHGKCLRIWSAGCSSGEEPYSVAILLHKMTPEIADWNISILATDINHTFLEKAKKGIYNKWSFRSTPEWVKNGYFTKNQDNSFSIMPFIKKMVSFSYHNLAKDPFPLLANNTTAFDIIFCRNVIMYFHPELARKMIDLFFWSLLDAGWLIVSGSEGYLAHGSRFVTVVFPETIFFMKNLSRSGKTEEYHVKTTGSVHHETIQFDSGLHPETDLNFPESSISCSPGATAVSILKTPDATETTGTKGTKPDPIRKAAALYDQCNYPEAESALTDYLLNDQNNIEAITLLAKIFSNQGKFNEAIELCRKGIETDKFNPVCHYLLALIFQEQGKTEEAISSLHSSIYLDHDHVLSYYTLGNILFQQGDMKKAGKYFNNALSILDKWDKEIILPGSDGLSAGRLTEILKMKKLTGNNS